jgi:predicted metal-binding membrane protein
MKQNHYELWLGRTATTNMSSTPPIGASDATHDHWFYALSASAFLASVVATVRLCRSMSGGMDMPGGWTMSMAWMKMPGQSWSGASWMFAQMWFVMMVAMMTPSLVPMLTRYRQALRREADGDVSIATLRAAIAYFAVWQAVGVISYPLGVTLASAAMRWASLSRLVPALTGAALVLSGIVQLGHWKRVKLDHCRDPNGCSQHREPSAGGWRHGLQLGACCSACCSGFMLALLVLGSMNLFVMTIVAVAISGERLLPQPGIAVRVSGAAMLATGAAALVQLI